MLPDTVLGHYRILSSLGKGGMGEVYAAEDTKLHRTVALKVLPQVMAADPDRRRRFEREAQAVAALNHPNIVTIYSVEEVGGVVFLTMEAVDGRTLKDRLGDGRMPVPEILRIGIAVSDAMAAAHQRGITHRDLKPANVMVTPDGRVKVLDFGLAKLRDAQGDVGADQATKLASDDLTGEGRIIGTVAYMSPEQAEGRPIDSRSDIFSFGVMLHEMATGDRPFKGDTDISVISSILKETPGAITDSNPDLPSDLARIVRRCLAKDPGRRYQTATDLRNELEELKEDLDSGMRSAVKTEDSRRPGLHGPASAAARSSKTWLALGAVAIVAIAAGLYFWLRPRGAAPSSAGATFAAERFTRLTDNGTASLAAISADGRYVVHMKSEAGLSSLWVRQTATSSDVRVVPPARVRVDGMAFSPDGNYVFYVTYPPGRGIGSLYRVPTLGGASIRVLEDIDSPPAFSPDGLRIAFVRGEVVRPVTHLMIAGTDGTGARSLAAPEGASAFTNDTPAWSRDGRTILVLGREGPLKAVVNAVDAATGSVSKIGESWLFARNVSWMPDGASFIMDGVDSPALTSPQLWQVTYPSGGRRRITNDLNGYVGASISGDGSTLATVQSTTQTKLWVVPPAGGEGKEVPLSGAGRSPGTAGVAWTPDGRVVFVAATSGNPQIWIAGADGSEARQLTSGELPCLAPAVSPDGRWIYYMTDRDAVMQIWRMGIDGSDRRQLTSGADAFRPVVSPDGKVVYFTGAVEGQNRAMKVAAEGGDATRLSDGIFSIVAISRDGTTLLGTTWNQAKQRTECATLPAAGGSPHLLGDVGATNGAIMGTCRWDVSESSLTYLAFRDGRMNIFVQPVNGGPERQFSRFPRDEWPEVISGAWSRDGHLVVARAHRTSDVVLISR